MKTKILFPILIVGVFFFACDNKKETNKNSDTLSSGTITISADQGFKPIIEAEKQVFEALFPTAKIHVKYTSEAEAFTLFFDDSVRMVIVSRPLSDKEASLMVQKTFNPRSIKIATSGIALITNQENKDSLITLSNLKDIFTGRLTQWNEIYKSSILGNLQIVFDHTNSGTVRFAKDSICQGEPLSPKLNALNSNEDVINYISKNKNAIGIIDAAYVSSWRDSITPEFRKDIRVMAISAAAEATPENSYLPYQAYLATGDYPLSRGVYIILNDLRAGLAQGFTNFIIKEKGQRIILKTGILPSTQPVRLVHIKD